MADFSGHLSLVAAVRPHGRTVLAEQSFRAPYHLSKAYWDNDAKTLLLHVVNPTAGILAGDQLHSDITVQPGASLLVTTPSASRVFRMAGGAATSVQRFAVSAGGWLEVLPEPLVPHRGSNFHQVTAIDVAAGGGLFFVDQLMPGRIGHGETWCWDRLVLELTVKHAGELVLRERFAHQADSLRELAALAGSGAEACFANALLFVPRSEQPTSEAPWREAVSGLQRAGVWIGMSALRKGGWSIKVVTPNALALRQTVRELRAVLATYFPQLGCDPRKL